MSQGLSLLELVRDRWKKHGLYDSPTYWDKKATAYAGLARSNWPSNAYNEHVHAAQMAAVDAELGEVRGLRIADVGCGTGRASVHLAERGARVTEFDFSPLALAAARRESTEAGAEVEFVEHNLLSSPPAAGSGAFDVALTIGCLALACKDVGELERALGHLVALVRPGGTVLLLEPIHASRLLTRILRLTEGEWIRAAEARGLTMIDRRAILFVPSRYALAFRDLPALVNDPVFALGERLLGLSPSLGFLGDYKVLRLRAPG